jgi:putative ABC transport system permease protein
MLEIKPIFNAIMRSKTGAVLLVLQIAITLAIVSNALAIIKDRAEYLQTETGYPEENLIQISTNVFAKDSDYLYLIEETERTLRGINGVVNASVMNEIPLSGSGSASSFGTLPVDQRDDENYHSVRTAYTGSNESAYNTLGIKLIEGRMFEAQEVIKTLEGGNYPSVVVVTKDYLAELYPEGDGLGQFIYIGNHPVQIIGVFERAMGPWPSDSRPLNFSIFPLIEGRPFQKFIVRTESGMRDQVMQEVEEVLLTQFNQRVIMNVQELDDAKHEYMASDTLMLRMLVVLIILLVAITALGIFGMTVFNISKRTKQIGTRRALGARKSAVVSYFLVENSILSMFGVALGSLGAIYLGQLLFEHYSVPAFDPIYILYTGIFVLLMSLLSVLLPANRAANIPPSIATRTV